MAITPSRSLCVTGVDVSWGLGGETVSLNDVTSRQFLAQHKETFAKKERSSDVSGGLL